MTDKIKTAGLEKPQLIMVLIVFAVVGSIVLLASRAATPTKFITKADVGPQASTYGHTPAGTLQKWTKGTTIDDNSAPRDSDGWMRIRGYEFDGPLLINTSKVELSDCKVTLKSNGTRAIGTVYTRTSNIPSDFIIDHCHIDQGDTGWSVAGITGYKKFTVRYSLITGVGDGIKLGSNAVAEHNYIQVNGQGTQNAPGHIDGIHGEYFKFDWVARHNTIIGGVEPEPSALANGATFPYGENGGNIGIWIPDTPSGSVGYSGAEGAIAEDNYIDGFNTGIALMGTNPNNPTIARNNTFGANFRFYPSLWVRTYEQGRDGSSPGPTKYVVVENNVGNMVLDQNNGTLTSYNGGPTPIPDFYNANNYPAQDSNPGWNESNPFYGQWEWPNETNTGFRGAGLSEGDLKEYTGPSSIRQDNLVLDGYKFNGEIKIYGKNVTIKNSKGGSFQFGAPGGLLENVTLSYSNSFTDDGYTARYCNYSGGVDGPRVHHNTLLEYNYIHDLILEGPDPHNDGIQFYSPTGNWSDVTLRRNYIINEHNQTSAILVGGTGTVTNVIIEENVLIGGGYTVYPERATVRNNLMGSGRYGYINYYQGQNWPYQFDIYGNVDYITGESVDRSGQIPNFANLLSDMGEPTTILCQDQAANNTGQPIPCTYDTDPPPDPPASSLPVTFSFDDSADFWSGQGNTLVSHSNTEGSNADGALKIDVSASGQYPDSSKTARAGTAQFSDGITISGGQQVYGSFYVKSSSARNVRCEIRFFSGSSYSTVEGVMSPASNNWTKRTCQATAPSGTTNVALRFFAEDSNYGETFFIDDATISDKQTLPPDPDPNPVKAGDTDSDSDVDIADLSKLLSDWNPTGGASGSPADFNGDGKVDVVDLSVLLSNYGS